MGARLLGAYHFDGCAVDTQGAKVLLEGGKVRISDREEVEIRCAGGRYCLLPWPWIFAAASRPWMLGAFAGARVGRLFLISHPNQLHLLTSSPELSSEPLVGSQELP